MKNSLNIDKKVLSLAKEVESDICEELKKCDELCLYNTEKVLTAFINNGISTTDFNGTDGYGYNDAGREKIESIYSEIFEAEDSLVRTQFISGSHALTVALFACLRPGDIMLSITGLPYDTLHEVIGIRENDSSLMSYGIKYEQIDLLDNDFDIDRIVQMLKNNKVKLIEIQRSKGYSSRKSITIEQIERVVKSIRAVDKDVIIMVDNCYCEFVEDKSPLEVGADLIVGSLIKNLGAGLVPNGGYISGKKELVHLASERLGVPGEAKEVGPTIDMNKKILQGIYMAPSVVNSSLKTAIFASCMLERLGFDTEPKYNDKRADIVQSITFNDPDKMIRYCGGIQMASAIDSYVKPVPDDMPGYGDKIIMAAGTFVQGSTIELSCDGPLREPYTAFQQGGLTYEYGKLGVMKAITEILK